MVFAQDDDLTAKAFALADDKTGDLDGYEDEAPASMLADVAADTELREAAAWILEDLEKLLTEPRQGRADPRSCS